MKTISLFGFEFHSSKDNAQVLDYFRNGKKTEGHIPFLITPNVDQIVKISKSENAGLRSQLQKSAIVLPDGQPIVWTSKLKSRSDELESRLTGSDLFPELWNQFKSDGKKVFFILPNDDLGELFKKEHEGCDYLAPPYFDLNSATEFEAVLEDAVNKIKAFDPDHVFVGLGFPKQERLALAIYDQMKERNTFYHLLGASFEFYHGKKKRAPLWLQRLGLEFLHRLVTEPGRMIKRYLVDDLAFFPLLIRELRRPK